MNIFMDMSSGEIEMNLATDAVNEAQTFLSGQNRAMNMSGVEQLGLAQVVAMPSEPKPMPVFMTSMDIAVFLRSMD